jgi:hypothetical protein
MSKLRIELRVVAIYLSLVLMSMPLCADRILVIGDSLAEPTAAALQLVMMEKDHTDIIVQTTPYLGFASEMSSTAGLNTLTNWLNTWPDISIVHLSLGANDMGMVWTPAMAGTAQEANLLTVIMQDINTIADHIFMIRPDVKILWSSYDFFRPLTTATPAENNAIYLAMAERSEQLVVARNDGMSYLNLYGLFQVTYGFDGIRHTEFDPNPPIPAGDPSLPNPGLPSPYFPYQGDVSHPTPGGY